MGELWKDAQGDVWNSLGGVDAVTFEETEMAHWVERDTRRMCKVCDGRGRQLRHQSGVRHEATLRVSWCFLP